MNTGVKILMTIAILVWMLNITIYACRGVIYLGGEVAKASVIKNQQMASEKFRRKHNTTAAWKLDMEADIYEVKQIHYDIIDDIIDNVRENINKEMKYWLNDTEKNRAYFALATVNFYLQKYNYNQGHLLSQGLDKKELDCDLYSVVYISVGEALNLPIVGVHVDTESHDSNHVFVRWVKDGETVLNWETTSGRRITDNELEEWLCPNVECKYTDLIRDNWKGQLALAYQSAINREQSSLQKIVLKFKKNAML